MSSLAPIRAHASTRLRGDSAFAVQDTPPRPPWHANMPLMQLCEHVYLVRFCCACLCIQSAYRQWAECWLSFGLLVHVLPYTWICWVLDRNRGSVALVRQHLVPALSFFLRVHFCVGCASHFPVYTTAAVLCVLVPVGDNVEHVRSWSFVLLRVKGRLRRLFLSFSEKVRVRCAIPGLSATYASGVFVCCTNLHSNTQLCWCGWLRWPEMLYALVQPN